MNAENPPSDMAIRLHYQSRRREIWWWYRRRWRRQLWKTHLTVFFLTSTAVMVSIAAQTADQSISDSIWWAIAAGFVSIAWFPLYPQIKFKPQTRILEISSHGIETTIGKISAKRGWAEIRDVECEENYVIIQGRNGNAFVIPPRAFASEEEHRKLVAFMRQALEVSQA